ncbi:MAG: hypothetical protein EB102_08210, partial [Gammaproteobacteria bacterium]|nr:hypothetical protein [Gammaproteobacteria bacterium]
MDDLKKLPGDSPKHLNADTAAGQSLRLETTSDDTYEFENRKSPTPLADGNKPPIGRPTQTSRLGLGQLRIKRYR